MKKLLFLGAWAFITTACGQGDQKAQPAKAGPEVGRFAIVHGPHSRQDMTLLDTASGQTWERIEMDTHEGNPVIWVPLAREDNEAEMKKMLEYHPPKSAGASEAP